jgi:hypothetical protein
MRRFVRLILFTLFCACCTRYVSAQNAIDKNQPLNLDSLSSDDKALLEQYKDSFDQEFLDVMALFDKSKAKKTDTTVYDMDRSSHVEAGLGFASRILIYGRDEGLNGVGFYPGAAYIHKTGLFVGLSLGFYTDSVIAHSTRVPLVSLSAGYLHTFFKRWLVGVSYSRNFITYGSVGSQQLLNNDIAFTTGVDIWKKIFIGTSLYLDWSSLRNGNLAPFEKRAIEIPVTLRKEFIFYKILGAKVFTLTPALTAYFATDNTAFILTRAVAEQEKASLAQFTTNVAHFFGFTDIEPSVSIDWRIRNLDICAVPALAIPFNLFEYPTYSKINNQLFQETAGGRVFNPKQYKFYLLASIKYLFCVKKKPRKGAAYP